MPARLTTFRLQTHSLFQKLDRVFAKSISKLCAQKTATHVLQQGSDALPLQAFVSLASASSGATSAVALRQSVPEKTVVGIFRDLRGIAMATNSRRTYSEARLALF